MNGQVAGRALPTPWALISGAVTAVSALFTVLALWNGSWVAAATWAFCTTVWAFATWADATDRLLLVTSSRHAKMMLELTERAVLVLRRQGEDRPEVMDQTGWLIDSIEAKQPELRAVANRTSTRTGTQIHDLLDGLWLDIAPAIEQLAVDVPTRRNRGCARRARTWALRASQRRRGQP